MPIVFNQISALFQGNEAVANLVAGKTYTLEISYFRATGRVKIAVIECLGQALLYTSWSALMEDWSIAGILY